jgi:ATP-dependent Lhr-like helicase
LKRVLDRASGQEKILISIERFSPLAFPLWVERQRNRISTEGWRERVQRMIVSLEKNAARQPRKRL